MSADLSGTSILVTGAGRGLGREMATALAEAGANVALLERDRPELDEAAAQIGAATDPGRVLAVQGDATNADDAARRGRRSERGVRQARHAGQQRGPRPAGAFAHQYRAAPPDLGGRSRPLAGDNRGQFLGPLHHVPGRAPRHARTQLGTDRQRDHQPGHDAERRPRPLRPRQGGDRGADLDPRLRAGGNPRDRERAGPRRAGEYADDPGRRQISPTATTSSSPR